MSEANSEDCHQYQNLQLMDTSGATTRRKECGRRPILTILLLASALSFLLGFVVGYLGVPQRATPAGMFIFGSLFSPFFITVAVLDKSKACLGVITRRYKWSILIQYVP